MCLSLDSTHRLSGRVKGWLVGDSRTAFRVSWKTLSDHLGAREHFLMDCFEMSLAVGSPSVMVTENRPKAGRG